MPRIDETRDLPVSVRDGFDYITNVRNWRSYWPGLVDIPDEERISWSKPGDHAKVVLLVRGKPVEMDMDLEQFEPYELVAYRSTQPGLPAFHHERHFRDKDGSLEYTLVISFEPRGGLRGIVDRLFVGRIVKQALVETANNLEERLRRR